MPVMLSLAAAFIWSITNHIDKYVLCKIGNPKNNLKTLLLFSSFVAGLVILPLWLIISRFQVSISFISLLSVFGASIFCILATYFYFKALENNDTSVVIAMLQLIPVFSYLLTVTFFKESLSKNELIGALLIIISAIFITFDFNESSTKIKALVLMTFSSLFYSLDYFFFDIAIRNDSYTSCSFWYQIGLLLIGIFLMLLKNYRSSFIETVKTSGKIFFSLNITNEVLNLIANFMINFANLTIPLALANTLDGFQGAFTFIIGIVGVLIFPKVFAENLDKKIILQKVMCILLGIVGLIIMFN